MSVIDMSLILDVAFWSLAFGFILGMITEYLILKEQVKKIKKKGYEG